MITSSDEKIVICPTCKSLIAYDEGDIRGSMQSITINEVGPNGCSRKEYYIRSFVICLACSMPITVGKEFRAYETTRTV